MSAIARARGTKRRVLPGFGLTLGFTLSYLGFIVLIPLAGVLHPGGRRRLGEALGELSNPRTLAAFRVSFGTAFIAALPQRRLRCSHRLGPRALPVSGTAIRRCADRPAVRAADRGRRHRPDLALRVDGLDRPSAGGLDIHVAFTRLGIFVALVFVGLPFVVRTVEPVLRDLEREHEEAAALLGASRSHILARVILPPLVPAVLTGFTLAFARAIGEYGSVIFIAGNMPGFTEIMPLLIVIKLEQFDYAGATVIAALMLIASFVLLFAINLLQAWTRRRQGG